ncbi:MAG: MauE/DoxX family redox-associated membrane protein [Candidatus Paceibacterota bacterium]
MKNSYTIKDFYPLIYAVSFVLLASAVFIELIPSATNTVFTAARVFMGFFFLTFGIMKAYNTKGFASAFSMYDPLAKRSSAYAHVYPFIEIMLGSLYLAGLWLVPVNILTAILMTVGAYGVAQKLREKETIPCACMGAVFKIPMTWVTLGEDLLMATMAVYMLTQLLL